MFAVSSSELLRALQERASRALPAAHIEHSEGWWLRHAPNCSWWVGSVQPHTDTSPDELPQRIIDAEKFYATHGATTRFQITPGACPEHLDTALATRGYHRQSPISLQVASTTRILEPTPTPAPTLRIHVHDRPTSEWFETWHSVHTHADPHSERAMLDRVKDPSAYASALIGHDVVAVGRTVADTGWAGVFNMATRPEARGKGAARQVLTALASWASTHEADHMYLQVEPDNPPALRLYERAGFREICRYHYRNAE
ncbi:N-acetyltransferase GCN5 [Acrocarpospora corrugata]|uniref:N-acetyltransferase GCN5 n=1 Tax=Acrocarpospora corrugata TaxID=35763 RepID=A0A5M3W3V9_9ACTN|nr:GNAT family N-acetyltransferase [Acrocarpospora corrugata]GES01983.1 N-acetyltransferase GCN5 [Acrocarpospora corrugata]